MVRELPRRKTRANRIGGEKAVFEGKGTQGRATNREGFFYYVRGMRKKTVRALRNLELPEKVLLAYFGRGKPSREVLERQHRSLGLFFF